MQDHRTLRFLVIDAHPFQRAVSVNLLRQTGSNLVFNASDGRSALRLLIEIGYVDVVFFDLRLNDMDCFDFLDKLGELKLAGAGVVCETLTPDMRRAFRNIIELRGMRFLSDIEKPFNLLRLNALLAESSKLSRTKDSAKVVISVNEQELRNALLEEQIIPYYQPKFELESGIVQSVEVLARWHHPRLGVLQPLEFLPDLKRYKLMDSLLSSQLFAGLKLQKKALDFGHALNFSFNLESSQLNDHFFTSRMREILSELDMPASRITFELTESGLLSLSAVVLENLVRLRMMGCGLSIDDFGAGFSSLQRLCQLPFNEIKLDSEFVRGLIYDPHYSSVITSTLALGDALGMAVVIEGVETEEQRIALLKLGCKLGQGYICAKPMGSSELLAWMENRQPFA